MTTNAETLQTLSELYGADLATVQQALEQESYDEGARRFMENLLTKIERNEGADTAVARPLLANTVPIVAQALKDFLEKKGPGRRHKAQKYLADLNPERVAYITLRTLLYNLLLASKSSASGKESKTSVQAITSNLGRAIEDEARFGSIRDRDPDHWHKAILPNIQKRSGDVFRRAYVRAVEKSMRDQGTIKAWDSWPNDDTIMVGLKMLEIVIETTGMVTIQTNKAQHAMNSIHLTPDTEEWLVKRTGSLAALACAPMPMVLPPKPWSGHIGGGYWFTETRRPTDLVRGSGRRNKKYRDLDLSKVLRAVNTIQNTAWHINQDVLKVALEVTQWKNPPIKKMPKPEPFLQPEPFDGDPQIAIEEFKEWKKDAAQKYRLEKVRRSRWQKQDFTLSQAKKFADFERIWFPYSLDFRGRIYADTIFSPQGSDLDKGLLLLADPCELGPDGMKWLKLQGANTAGYDKEPMDVRLKWVEDNHDMILSIAAAPLDELWWTGADSPFCFLAFCFEYKRAVEQGESYRCGLPVAFDGSCSGIQHFSAMLRDELGGKAVNLIPSDRPSDIYRMVAEKVQKELERDASLIIPDTQTSRTDEETGEITILPVLSSSTMARNWLAFGVDRSVTKRSVMTLPYGSKKFGFADQLLEDKIIPARDDGTYVFPQPGQHARYLANLIWRALSTTVVAAVEAMDWLQKCASALTAQQMPVHWVTPIGFPVWQEYRTPQMHRVDTVICGSLRIRMMINKQGQQDGPSPLDRHRQVNGISPNFVHSMDASHMMQTVNLGADRGVESFACIHDSFGTCPGRAGILYEAVRETFVETYTKNDVINQFFNMFAAALTEDAMEKIPQVPRKGKLDLSKVRESKYCFL
jgi:DNA-directed RNA polymerase